MQDRGQGTKLCVAPAVPPQLQLAACQPPAPATWSPARRRTTMLVKRAPAAAPAQTPLTQALAWAFPAQVRQDAWLRGSIPLRTCMEQGRGAGISMDQGVPDHWRGEMRKGRSSASHRGTPPPHSCHHLHSTCYTHAAGTTKDVLSTSPCVQGRLTWARPWGRSPSQGHFSARRAANLALGGQLVPVAQAQPGAHCECT